MRGVVQRVKRAKVTVDGRQTGQVEDGILLLLGIGCDDDEKDLDYICDKTVNLRIFEDDAGKMNKSIIDIGGSILLVSQFTLLGDARRGRRPSFTDAAPPERAIPLYEMSIRKFKECGIKTETGEFGAHMEVELTNDGPVTILLDSKKIF
jgi:D-tyrosyl-tRNA(Tyr) deacylase